MGVVLYLMILLIGIIGVESCTTTEIKEVEKIRYKTVYKENPFYIEDRTLSYFRDSFNIDKYTYYGSDLPSKVSKWADSLPERIRDSLINKKLIIQKIYYLRNIELQNYDKVESVQKLNTKMEFALSARIGMAQGIPSVVFTSSIENNNNKEYLIIKLNRLMY